MSCLEVKKANLLYTLHTANENSRQAYSFVLTDHQHERRLLRYTIQLWVATVGSQSDLIFLGCKARANFHMRIFSMGA